ncbi:DUF1990 family protein [Paramicrobacterium agarici]|uniref:Uncharacterized protein (UPF0548 family) n=1 Tax=Paramicrobacterium agarici TaxID=630514 RepID=A0A2A9DWN4_9MICO|nr:DUF1990 domain-containing protein [Microbacterium agarici]PFG31207.1 uncharacterized protein (UPF0548 family) [Microbacterium agarici]TQO24309.1 uncharacterized protein (UPF0548 family) [Microbacterium agarici]
MRRSNFEDQPTDYAAVGATQAADLLQYPPDGYAPYEDSIKIGSGDERFAAASASVLSWEVLRLAGITVSDIERGSGDAYQAVRFAEDGTPLGRGTERTEDRFASDGTPYITSGTTAVLSGRVGSYSVRGHVRVVYVVEDPRRVAFAFGTVSGHSISGEESFAIEHRDDDSVWFTVRAFVRPVGVFYKVFPFLLLRRRKRLSSQYLRALSPAWASDVRE